MARVPLKANLLAMLDDGWRRVLELDAVNWPWIESELSADGKASADLGVTLVAAIKDRRVKALSPLFDFEYYLVANPDVRESGMNPFVHYTIFGEAEGRRPCPLFDPTFYKGQVKLTADRLLLKHYEQHGAAEGLWPHPIFDSAYYIANNPDVAAAKINPLLHYVHFGFREGRLPNASLDPGAFLRASRDLNLDGLDGILVSLVNRVPPPAPTRGPVAVPEGIPTEEPEASQQVAVRAPLLSVPEVLYFSHNYLQQGAQRSLFELAVGLKAKGLTRPAVWSSGDGPFKHDYEQNGVVAGSVVFPSRGDPNENTYRRHEEKLRMQLAQRKPALVHANTLQTFYAVKAAIACKIPTVWNIRESEEPKTYFNYLPEYLREEAYRTYAEADAIVFVSETTRDLWDAFMPRKNVHVIPNGLDRGNFAGHSGRRVTRKRLGIDSDSVVFLCVGTVTTRKNQAVIVDAFAKLPSSVTSKANLIFVGANESEYCNRLRVTIESLPRAKRERIQLIPETSNHGAAALIASYYLASDVFILASRLESYPRVVVEAMSFGLPVATTPCFGTTEQVDATSGIFFGADDSGALADAMIRLVSDTEWRRSLGRGARERYAKALTSKDDMIAGYSRLYAALLGGT